MTITQIILSIIGVILTTLLTWLVEKITKKIDSSIKNDKIKNLLNNALSLVERGVKQTYQTYVESLKDKDMFTIENQNQALEHCKNLIINDLQPDFKQYLLDNKIAIEDWVVAQIEAKIYDLKR